MCHKCSIDKGASIYINGMYELDPCIYEDIEAYKNVTVYVRRCKNCGYIDIAWKRQPDTVELENEYD